MLHDRGSKTVESVQFKPESVVAPRLTSNSRRTLASVVLLEVLQKLAAADGLGRRARLDDDSAARTALKAIKSDSQVQRGVQRFSSHAAGESRQAAASTKAAGE